MPELRFNPLLGTWTMVASNRQKRPNLDKKCPFCPGSGKIPGEYEVLAYDNDFPALKLSPDGHSGVSGSFYKTEKNYGKCEVILYSPKHSEKFSNLPAASIKKIVDLWINRVSMLSRDKKIKYVFVFENRGEEVGVTMLHPHGQIYAYPFVPLKIQTELDNCKKYYSENKRCMLCDMNLEEKKFKKRVVYENDDFVAYVPFFTDYPFGVFVAGKKHIDSITLLSEKAKVNLAKALKAITGAFDLVFNRPFPYMMCFHQSPVNEKEYFGSGKYYHFHIEFYTPLRAGDKIKYYASSEMGAWAACNTFNVEETSGTLRGKIREFAHGSSG